MPDVSIIVDVFSNHGKNAGIRLTPLPNPNCQGSTGPEAPIWEELYAPFVHERIRNDGSLAVGSRPSQAWVNANLSNRFFGTLNTGELRPITTTYREKWKPTSSFKEFKRRRDAGEIVINPLRNYTIKLTSIPTIDSLRAAPSSFFTVDHTTKLPGFPELVETGCVTYPEGIVWSSGAACLQRTVPPTCATVRQQWYTAGTLSYALDEAGLQNMGALLSYAINQVDADGPLITTTLCEARAGALDLSTALAEAPETIGSIYSACKFILNAYLECRKKVARLNNSRDPAVTQAIADLWLQYRYGIMPNVYLLEDALEYLYATERVYSTERAGTPRVMDFSANGWTADEINILDRCYVKNRFGVGFTKPHLQTNLAVTAWELVPLSFVIDWVLNIGDIMGSLTPTYGSVQEAVLYSRRTKTLVQLRHPDWIGAPVTAEIDGYNAFPIEDVYKEIGFGLSPVMTFKRWLDAAALSWSSFRRVYRSALRSIR